MMRPPKGAVRTVLAAPTAACIARFVGVAFGAIPGAGGRISACYGKIGGVVRVIAAEAGAHCTNLEKPFSFSGRGPKGDPGQKGTPLACSSLAGRQTDSVTFSVPDTTEIDTQEFRIKVYPSSAPGTYKLEVSGDV